MKFGFFAVLVFLFSPTATFGQSSRVLKFSVRPSNSGDIVQVLWTMNAGSTCLDLIVERSLTSEVFSEIYKYPSVCGSTDSAISYSWVDSNPLRFSKSFYRLKLDGAEFTLPLEVDIQSNLSEKDIISYPNPSNGKFFVELKNESNLSFDLELYHLNGALLYKKENCKGKFETMDLINLSKGVYIVRVFFSNQSSLESKLIIKE